LAVHIYLSLIFACIIRAKINYFEVAEAWWIVTSYQRHLVAIRIHPCPTPGFPHLPLPLALPSGRGGTPFARVWWFARRDIGRYWITRPVFRAPDAPKPTAGAGPIRHMAALFLELRAQNNLCPIGYEHFVVTAVHRGIQDPEKSIRLLMDRGIFIPRGNGSSLDCDARVCREYAINAEAARDDTGSHVAVDSSSDDEAVEAPEYVSCNKLAMRRCLNAEIAALSDSDGDAAPGAGTPTADVSISAYPSLFTNSKAPEISCVSPGLE